MVWAIGNLSATQAQMCEMVPLCKQQLEAAHVVRQQHEITNETVLSLTSPAGHISLGACTGGATGSGPMTCQRCIQTVGCHWCVYSSECVRDYSTCTGDPWKAVVSTDLNPYNFKVACPSASSGKDSDGLKNYSLVVSYLGGIAMTAFVTHPEVRPVGLKGNNSVQAFRSSQTCLPGTYSEAHPTGLPPCGKCGPGKFSDAAYLNHECRACPAGKLSHPGSKALSDCQFACSPGYASPDGFTNCRPCVRGSYALGVGSLACTRCPSEHYTLREGSAQISDCIRVQIGVDRILKAGMKLFVSVWWLAYSFVDRRDTITICKRLGPVVIGNETITLTGGSAADACRILAWAYTSQAAQYIAGSGVEYLPGDAPHTRGSIEFNFDSGGEGVYEVRYYSHKLQGICLSTFWDSNDRKLHVVQAGSTEPHIALPPDTGFFIPKEKASRYAFPAPEFNSRLQIETSPLCACVDKFIPIVCTTVDCTDGESGKGSRLHACSIRRSQDLQTLPPHPHIALC